jgi:aspartyl-tRNA(Asn)/glutamyl-tRNA(Gln) amidotransferase subunit B
MEYEAVIGLETHVQLRTETKMWCSCRNEYGSDPNTNVCPVCLGFPGALPVANEKAMELTVLTGLLLNCRIPDRAQFERKNYFYPDSAKNYQITQLALPSTVDGFVEFEMGDELRRVRINRAHLEEDVGKSFHFDGESGVDFNRGGVPLLEIVTEPDITSADMAYEYLTSLKAILEHGGISDCDMEKGMVRCDINVSVRPVGATTLGEKVEIKNMNSFSGVRRALLHEIPRQIEAVRRGEKIRQETRRWDDAAGITETMRTKEDAHDYRYFPCPDLMPFIVRPDWLESVKSRVVELPLARKRRLIEDYGISAGDADVFVNDVPLGQYFQDVVAESSTRNPKNVANWIVNTLRGAMTEKEVSLDGLKFSRRHFIDLLGLVESGKISRNAGLEVFNAMFETGAAPADIVDQKGLAQVSDSGALEAMCDEAIAANPRSVEDFRNGKAAALNFLKGQVMRLSKGKANPAVVGGILEKKIMSL